MEELTEVITAAEFHPNQCNTFVYSSSKGTIRLCDMRASALCDNHAKSEPTFTSSMCLFIDFKQIHRGRSLWQAELGSLLTWGVSSQSLKNSKLLGKHFHTLQILTDWIWFCCCYKQTNQFQKTKTFILKRIIGVIGPCHNYMISQLCNYDIINLKLFLPCFTSTIHTIRLTRLV